MFTQVHITLFLKNSFHSGSVKCKIKQYLHTPNDAIKMSCSTVNNVYKFSYFFLLIVLILKFSCSTTFAHSNEKKQSSKNKATRENLFPYKIIYLVDYILSFKFLI